MSFCESVLLEGCFRCSVILGFWQVKNSHTDIWQSWTYCWKLFHIGCSAAVLQISCHVCLLRWAVEALATKKSKNSLQGVVLLHFIPAAIMVLRRKIQLHDLCTNIPILKQHYLVWMIKLEWLDPYEKRTPSLHSNTLNWAPYSKNCIVHDTLSTSALIDSAWQEDSLEVVVSIPKRRDSVFFCDLACEGCYNTQDEAACYMIFQWVRKW